MSTSPSQLFNPFPGLRSFTSEEKHLFFGREDQVGELLRRLRERRFLAVVGPSGSGKSSLVRAGLLPELHGGTMTTAGSHWEVVIMKPGGDPLTNLAAALVDADYYDPEEPGILDQVRTTLDRSALGLVEAVRQSDVEEKTNTLVVVDQFEEIFRFREQGGQSQEEAAAFVKLLLEASLSQSPSLYVVLTMRSDYLGDCAQFRGLAQAVNDGEYLIPRLTRAQKRSAISGPIQVGGADISKRLLTKLLNDLGDDPDQLPVLQHALMRTWDYWARDHQEAEPIDLRHYEATGGMQEALSRHADEVFHSLPSDEDRRVAERVFKSLTEKVDEHRGIRRPMTVQNLTAVAGASPDELSRVIEAYRKKGCTFLMPPEAVPLQPKTIIDISHESLMRIWQRLRRWVADEAQSASIYRRLVETAHLHAEGKAGLYHDPDLPIAQAWREETRPNEAWASLYGGDFAAAVAFLDKSQNEAEREEREREAARQRELEQAKALAASQQRAAQLLRRFAVTVAIALVVAIGLTIWAFQLKDQAVEQSHLAKLRALDAQKAQAKAQLQQGKTSLALAQAAQGDNRLLESRMLAARALGFEGFGRTNLTTEKTEELPVLLDRNSSDWQQAARIAQGALPMELSWVSPKLRQYDGNVSAIAVHPAGRWAATGGELDNNVSIWDLEDGTLLHSLPGHSQDVEALAFSHDGSFLASAGDDGDNAIILWNTATWTSKEKFQLNSEGVHALAISPNDQTILAGDEQGQLFRVSLPEGNVEEFPDLYESQRITELRFSASGNILVGADWNGTIRIHDPLTLEVRGAIRLEPMVESSPIRFALSPDATWLAASSRQHGASLWDITQTPPVLMVELDKLIPIPPEDGFRFDGVAISDDGARLLLGWNRDNESGWRGFTGAISIFDVTNPKNPVYRHHQEGHRDFIQNIASVPQSHRYLSGDDEGLLLYRDADTAPEDIPALRGHVTFARQLVFSPDGRWFVSTSTAKDAFLWNAESASIHAHLSAHGDRCRAAVFSQDSRTLYTTDSAGRTVYVWDVASGNLRQQHNIDATINAMDLHPEGKELVVSGPSFTLFFFKVTEDGQLTEAGTTELNHSAYRTRFLPDGNHLITAGGSRRVLSLVERNDEGTWTPVRVRAGIHEGNINYLCVDPVTGGAATAAADGTVKLWTLAADGNLREETISLPGLANGLTCAEFSSDGARLLTADSESVKLWNRNTGQLLARLPHPNRARTAIFSPDDAHVLSTADDGLLRLWYLGHDNLFAAWPNLNGAPTAATPSSEIDRGPFGLAFLDQGRSLAIGGGFPEDSSAVKIWNFDQNSFEKTLPASPDALVTGIEPSPDGRYLAVAQALLDSGNANGNVSILNLDPNASDSSGRVFLVENLASIWVNWHPNGNLIVSSHLDGSIRLWSRQGEGTWKPAKQPLVTEGSDYGLRKPVFSRDGTRLFVGSRANASVYPFDPATEALGSRRRLSHNWGIAVAVAKDLPLLVTGSPAGSDVRFWNADTLESIADPFRFDFRPLIINLSDDGRYLAAYGTQARLTVLDISNVAAPISVLDLGEENGFIFRGSAFSPDSSLFACAYGGPQGFVRVYRLGQNEGQDRFSSLLNVMEFTETGVAWADLRNMSLQDPRVLFPPEKAPHPYLGFLREPDLAPDQASDRLFHHYLQQRRVLAAYAVLKSQPEMDAKNASALARYAIFQLRQTSWGAAGPTPQQRHLASVIENLESKLPPDKQLESKLLNEEWEDAIKLFQDNVSLDQATRAAMADRFLLALEQAVRRNAVDGTGSLPPKPLALAGVMRLNLQETLQQWSGEPTARVITLRPGIDESIARLASIIGQDVQPILARGALWKFFPDDAAAPLHWTQSGFDDQSWPSGPSDIGFGGAIDRRFLKTIIPEHENRMTYYFRHSFPLDALPGPEPMQIQLQRDDGVALYLNGQEILRDNLPEGVLQDDTAATEVVGGQNESTYFTFLRASLPFRIGTNTLAAEVHQNNPGSTDIHFDLAIQPAGALDDATSERALDLFMDLASLSSSNSWKPLLPALSAKQSSNVPETASPLAWVARARMQSLLRRPAEERAALERAVTLLQNSEDPADWRRQRDLLRRLEEIYTDLNLTERGDAAVSRVLSTPPRPGDRPPEQLDLTPFYNSSLYDPRGWLSERWPYANLRELPETYAPIDGIHFDIRGVVQLESGVYEWEGISGGAPLKGQPVSVHSGRDFPAQVTGIPVGRPANTIHLLAGSMLNREPAETEIARVIFHYEDGSTETLPLLFGQNILGLWAGDNALQQVGPEGLAWASTDLATGTTRKLGRVVWRNPHPEKVIQSFDFVSALQECAPFLIAATIE